MPADGQRVTRRLAVAVVDGGGRDFHAPGLARWLQRVAPRAARGEVTIAFVSDARMRTLNRTFRGLDAPTDVLSFSTPPGPNTDAHLGDVVIARGVARRQAREQAHAESTEWRVLALHGLLHLLGYDHETDAGTMLRVESRLRRRGGLRSGLIGRGSCL